MIVPIFLFFVTGAGNGYDVPRELKYTDARSGTIDSADTVMTCDYSYISPLLTHFYPIGWSADGKFAYVSLFDDHGDAYGYINCQVSILDVDRGQVVWTFAPADTENPSDTPFRKIWRRNQAEIEKNLRSCGIVQSSFSFQDFPIYSGSEVIDYYLDTNWVGNDQSKYGWECIDSLKFIIRSTKTGDRVLLDKGDYAALGVYVPGYLKNPRGPEIVIPLIATYMGWEGPPNTTGIVLLGYNLR